ncbi:MAG TPA: cytochrome C [Sulfurimonas autotrophica]|nr:cytochrome C [Sulfurimonas autotrophica]
MKKFLFIALFLALLNISSSNAAIYKGQRVFIKKCLKCHESGQNFVAKYKMKKWKKLMKKKGKGLAEIHLKSKKAKKSWKYFKSKKYARKAKHLKQFLIEYAKDSGNVPACN